MEAEHIFARRMGYTHHGLYIGNGRVIHFSGEPTSKSQAKICETNIGTFSNGDNIFIVKYKNCFPIIESLERAKMAIGQGDYNLIKNNCEHFATWCKTGKFKSKQVDSVKNALASHMGTFLVTAVTPLAIIRFALLGLSMKSMLGYAYITGVEPFEF